MSFFSARAASNASLRAELRNEVLFETTAAGGGAESFAYTGTAFRLALTTYALMASPKKASGFERGVMANSYSPPPRSSEKSTSKSFRLMNEGFLSAAYVQTII